jgi:hypothetical protein
MFYQCTSLGKAPELPAAILTTNCYYQMFYGCTNLSYIKCLATDISASNCTANWAYGVFETGAFVTQQNPPAWTIDSNNGIPLGWSSYDELEYASPHNYETVKSSVRNLTISSSSAADAKNIHFDIENQEIYYGSDLVANVGGGSSDADTDVDLEKEYFSITASSDNTIVQYWQFNWIDMHPQYSLDDGVTWADMPEPSDASDFGNTSSSNKVVLQIGDRMLMRGYIDSTSSMHDYDGDDHEYLTPSRTHVENTSARFYINASEPATLSGNIMTLQNGELTGEHIPWGDPRWHTIACYAEFAGLFFKCNVDNVGLLLPATTLTSNCYESMFEEAHISLVPYLPALACTKKCYHRMFLYNPSLYSFDDGYTLPALTLAEDCYRDMFNNCENLDSLPVLPATTMAMGCYRGMFMMTGLTNADSSIGFDLLPATKLAPWCYKDMFCGCTSLTTAPELKALDRQPGCYETMFR